MDLGTGVVRVIADGLNASGGLALRVPSCPENVCLDDDNQGESVEVLWEMELGAQVVDQETGGLGADVDEPRPTGRAAR